MKGLQVNIAIVPMSEDDLSSVLLIESASFPRPWSRGHFIDELNSPHSFPLVALTPEGDVAGYICPMIVLDEGHILDVAVSGNYRGLGIGRMLVTRVLGECQNRGAAFVSLEVRVSNSAAISLYQSIGFTETGRRKKYYENGDDAVLMEYIFQTERGK